MLNNIPSKILKDKYKIVTSCLSIIPVVIEWNQIIENFWRYSNVIFFVLIFMGILLLYNHFYLQNPKSKINSSDHPDSINNELSNGKIRHNTGTQSVSDAEIFEGTRMIVKDNPDFQISIYRFFKSTFIYLLIATISIMVSSLYYINKRPIHYVLVKNNVTKDEAVRVSQKVNNKLRLQGVVGYQAVKRVKRQNPQKFDYMVSINGGYLSISDAKMTLKLMQKSLPGERGIELKTSNASLYRKLEYLGFYFFRFMSSRYGKLDY